MTLSELAPDALRNLTAPLVWSELDNESPSATNFKIRRAHDLGVVAVLFTSEQARQRIADLAMLEKIIHGEEIDNTVYIPVMNGGITGSSAFFMELVNIEPVIHPFVDYVDLSRYGDSQTGSDEPILKRRLRDGTDIKGKRAVFLDDVIEGAVTTEWLGDRALDPSLAPELGEGVTGPADSVDIITVVDKGLAVPSGFKKSSISRGMIGPNVWLGGQGMDDGSEKFRWTPEIVIPAVQKEEYRDTMPEILEILGARAVMGMDDITWVKAA